MSKPITILLNLYLVIGLFWGTHYALLYELVPGSYSGALSQSTQKRDCVARWGGEEFLTLLLETALEQATVITERLRENIAKMDCSYQDISIRVTLSIGIAKFNKKTNVDDLVKNRPNALNTKTWGKNMVVANISFDKLFSKYL